MAVAFCPELVTTHIQKWCHVETEGVRTKGMLIVNWPERYTEDRPKTKIVTKVDG